MTTHEPQVQRIPAELRGMLARARPDQIQRLLNDIHTGVASDRPKGEA